MREEIAHNQTALYRIYLSSSKLHLLLPTKNQFIKSETHIDRHATHNCTTIYCSPHQPQEWEIASISHNNCCALSAYSPQTVLPEKAHSLSRSACHRTSNR